MRRTLVWLLFAAVAVGPHAALGAKPSGLVVKRDKLKGCLKNFNTHVNEKLVKEKDGEGKGRGKVKQAKGSKYIARKKALSDYYGKTSKQIKYEQQSRVCSAQTFDSAAANRDYAENSKQACYNNYTKNPCAKDAQPCIDEVVVVFGTADGVDDTDTSDCTEFDCRPKCVKARALGGVRSGCMMLEASIRGEHDDATVTPNLSDMPEVLIPVYEHLRETSRKERFLQAAVIDEDDDFDTEQEEGVDIDTDERTNEVLDRVANKFDKKTVDAFCADLDDDDFRDAAVKQRKSFMDQDSDRPSPPNPNAGRRMRRNLLNSMRARRLGTYCCTVSGTTLSSKSDAEELECTDATTGAVADPSLTLNVDPGGTSPSCVCKPASFAPPDLLYTLGNRDMEMDCVSNGTGLCNIPDAGYDIPNDPDEPMPHYYAMLKRLHTGDGITQNLIPREDSGDPHWYKRKVSYMDKYEIMKKARLAQYISLTVDTVCAAAKAISVLFVGGFGGVVGTDVHPAEIPCAILILAPDTAGAIYQNLIADIDNQNSVIDGTETTLMYQTLHIVGYNQEVALDRTLEYTQAAGDTVAAALGDETTKIKNAITAMGAEVITKIETEHTKTRTELTQLVNSVEADILGDIADLLDVVTKSQNRVDASLCDIKTKVSLAQREVDYQRRLLLVPQGKMPGYVGSIKDANTTAYKQCNSPFGSVNRDGSSPLNTCTQLSRTNIAGTVISWGCDVPIA
eukprot:XP_001694133.1 predicted protein [Chlamydomonas reinhardtii]